jgi:hypothetical protein
MEIPKEYIKNKMKWELQQSKGNIGLYFNKDSKSFEVIVIRPNNKHLETYNIGGNMIQFKPYILPSNEDFGTFGWSFINKTNAENKLRELANPQNPHFLP